MTNSGFKETDNKITELLHEWQAMARERKNQEGW